MSVPARSPSPRPEDDLNKDDSGDLSSSSEDVDDDDDDDDDIDDSAYSECEGALEYDTAEAGGTLSGSTYSVEETEGEEMTASSGLPYEELVSSVAYLKTQLRVQYPMNPTNIKFATLLRGII